MGIKFKHGLKDRIKIKQDKVDRRLTENISPTEEIDARTEKKMLEADASIVDRKFDRAILRFGFKWRKNQYMKIFGHE